MKVRTKVCGLRTNADIDAAVAGGADYVGLVIFPKSPRNVSLKEASNLANRARGRVGVVALVVDPDDDLLTSINELVSPDVIQLHGSESPERTADVRAKLGRQVWKALPVETALDATRAFDYVDVCERILFDAKAPKGSLMPGGNGHTFDWSLLDALKGRVPFILSGGLTPANVAVAIAATSPWGVDVSSGVENSPGVKSPALIKQFLANVRDANAAMTRMAQTGD